MVVLAFLTLLCLRGRHVCAPVPTKYPQAKTSNQIYKALGRFFCTLQKILSTRIIDVCDRRVSPGQNFVPLYLSSKKPQQKIGEPSELANFLSGDDIARLCLVSQNSFTPSILH